MITKTDIEKYFLAEKQAGLLLLIIALAAILVALAGIFLFKTTFWKGIALSFILIAILEAFIGFTTYKAADDLRKDNVYALDMNPDNIIGKEIPRAAKVEQNLTIIMWAVDSLLIAGIVFIAIFRNSPARQLIYGIGIGIAIQSFILLGMTLISKKRTVTYNKQLQTIIKH